MSELKIGQKVMVQDEGLMELYRIAKSFDATVKPHFYGWVDKICDDGTIMVEFPIGDDDPSEHSQIAPYPSELVVACEWKQNDHYNPRT